MKDLIKKVVGIHNCFNCDKIITKREIYSVDIDTMDGPLNLKLCQNCSGDFDDMLKELEEIINTQRGGLSEGDYE